MREVKGGEEKGGERRTGAEPKTPKIEKGFGGISTDSRRESAQTFFGGAKNEGGGVRSMNTPPPIRAVPKTPNNGLGLGFNQDLLKNALANRRKGVNGSTPEDKNRGGGGSEDDEEEEWEDAK